MISITMSAHMTDTCRRRLPDDNGKETFAIYIKRTEDGKIEVGNLTTGKKETIVNFEALDPARKKDILKRAEDLESIIRSIQNGKEWKTIDTSLLKKVVDQVKELQAEIEQVKKNVSALEGHMTSLKENMNDRLEKLEKAPKGSGDTGAGMSGTTKKVLKWAGGLALAGLAAAGVYKATFKDKSKGIIRDNLGKGALAITAAAAAAGTAWYMNWHHKPVNWISNLLGAGDYYPSTTAVAKSKESSDDSDASSSEAAPKKVQKKSRDNEVASTPGKDQTPQKDGFLNQQTMIIIGCCVVGIVVLVVLFMSCSKPKKEKSFDLEAQQYT